MRLRSLESRIVALFLVLILAVQLAGFFAIQAGIQKNARAAILEELAIGERLFKRLLDQSAQKLTQGAQLLASDYGFREAIATDERETIESALLNHSGRINASHAVLIGLDRSVKASTADTIADPLEGSILQLISDAEKNGSATGFGLAERRPYQIVVVPVKAPVTIGWVAMAFAIDREIATEMRALSALEVSLFTAADSGGWVAETSTLPKTDWPELTRQLNDKPAATGTLTLEIDDSDFSARMVPITLAAGRNAIVVLQRSISEAVAPYRSMQFGLLILTAIATVLAVAGSIFMAKRITGPLRSLGETARRLGTGDYQGKIDIDREDEIGELSRAFASMRDGISKRELEIRRLAYWDTLTDLPNRAQFTDLLRGTLQIAQKSGQSCHILMMDLDRFKDVNDVMGHSFGDSLLRQVGQRLQDVVPNAHHIARLGGDEFALLLPDADLAQARALAGRILRSLEIPIYLDEQTVDLGAGIGIACYPEHGATAEVLLSRAEVAMYMAKKGGNQAIAYDPSFDKTSQQSLSLLSDLRRAVQDDQLLLYVQPKVALDCGRVRGLEVLVRWKHPERGMIFPDHFIPFAEKSGFIRTLTAWVLEHSAAMAAELVRRGTPLRMSVNLSTRDLMDPELPAQIGLLLERHKLTPSAFCFEITESAIMDDPLRAQQTLEALHAMGVKLSIDDFGTGYSSLAYLKRLPVQELKIDKSFVLKMESQAEDAKIVRSTIDLGHNLGLEVVAEGIEEAAAWEMLRTMGCDHGQGYFISRPMAADQFHAWLAQWAPPVAPAIEQAVMDAAEGRA